jgi:acyl-CoA thioester hydrolase
MPMSEFAMTFVTRWADLDANLHVKNTAYSEWASYVRALTCREQVTTLQSSP